MNTSWPISWPRDAAAERPLQIQGTATRPRKPRSGRSAPAPGYASPIGLKGKVKPLVIVDELVAASPNLVAGANEEGFHYLNTNYGRDYQADLVADIAAAY